MSTTAFFPHSLHLLMVRASRCRCTRTTSRGLSLQTSNEYIKSGRAKKRSSQRNSSQPEKPERARSATAADVEEPGRTYPWQVGSSPPPGIQHSIHGLWMWQDSRRAAQRLMSCTRASRPSRAARTLDSESPSAITPSEMPSRHPRCDQNPSFPTPTHNLIFLPSPHLLSIHFMPLLLKHADLRERQGILVPGTFRGSSMISSTGLRKLDFYDRRFFFFWPMRIGALPTA